MAKTVFAMITLLDDRDAIDPGYGRPGGGSPDHIGGGPIYHPGHPDHGLPSQPVHPGNRPPGSAGGRPDQSLPWAPGSPDQGLPVPPGINPPPVPPNLAQQVVVLWHMPGQTAWHGKVIDPATINKPDQGLPPTPPTTPDNTLPTTPAPKA